MTGPVERGRSAVRAIQLVDVVVVGAGFVLGGVPGAVVAAVGQVAARRYGPRAPAACALGALMLAGTATATSTWSSGSVLFEFAKDHRLAAEAGRAAGLFLLVALVGFVRDERTRSSRHDDRRSTDRDR